MHALSVLNRGLEDGEGEYRVDSPPPSHTVSGWKLHLCLLPLVCDLFVSFLLPSCF